MALISIFPKSPAPPENGVDVMPAPRERTRSDSIQRLQIGLAGLGTMILLIGLAQVVYDRAQLSEADSVPSASSTIAPDVILPSQSDPLAEAGVVPDLPAEPVGSQAQEPAIMPEQGNANPTRK